jgi:hypothetical protein
MESDHMAFIRRELPIYLMAIIIVIVTLDYFTTVTVLGDIYSILSKWTSVIIAMAMGMALINTTRINAMRITSYTGGKGDWRTALSAGVLLVCLFITLILGFTTTPFGRGTEVQWIYNNVFIPLDLTTFSLLGFYYFTATYRGWKARSLDMVFMIAAGVVGMLALTPLYADIPAIHYLWTRLTDVHNVGAANALRIILSVGLLVTSIRTMLGREVSYLGIEERR